MALQYVVTEVEMLALVDQLKLAAMQDVGHFRNWQDIKDLKEEKLHNLLRYMERFTL